MRRWVTGLTTVVLVAALAGCGGPAGADGDLTDDWPAFGEPTAFVPPAGVCLAPDFTETVHLATFTPVDCGTAHRVETAHVGTFTGASAVRPTSGSAPLRDAYAECDGKANEYLGGDWRTARLWLGVALPSAGAWQGGARWFRCDLVEQSSVEEKGATVTRTASLRGALAGDSPLKLGCYTAGADSRNRIRTMTAADCSRPHNVEFVGVWRAPENVPYPTGETDWLRFYTECRTLLGRYVGVPDDADLRFRSGVVAMPDSATRWRSGDRGVRCYLWLSHRTVNRSLRGAGVDGLPIRTG